MPRAAMATLNDILDASAAKFGRHEALMIKPGFRTRTWTYRDQADVVPRVARYLAEAGVRRRDRVITFGVNRPEYGITNLAALRPGAVRLHLDTKSPTQIAPHIT